MLSNEEILKRYDELNAELQSSIQGDISCAACQHWIESRPCESLIKEYKDTGRKAIVTWKGSCHLNPPTPVNGDFSSESVFPATNAIDHCSYFCRVSK